MFVVFSQHSLKPGHQEAFKQASETDAHGSLENEPKCFGFHLLQDQSDENIFYLLEVFENETGFKHHHETPHFKRWESTVKDLYAKEPLVYFAKSLFPKDAAWEKIKSILL